MRSSGRIFSRRCLDAFPGVLAAARSRPLPKRSVFWTAGLVLGTVFLGGSYLILEAFHADARNAQFQQARARADSERARAGALAELQGVPPDGAYYLLAA